MIDKTPKLRNVTIKDVAREAGVSYATVSRVLNAYPHIRPDKRQRVLDAVSRLGYVVNLQARSLVGGRSRVIGLLVPNLGNEYIGEVVRGVDEAAVAADYELMLHTTHRQTKESAYVNTLVGGVTAGLLLLVPLDPGAYVQMLCDRQFPYVVIDHHRFDNFSPTVSSTNWQGAYGAVCYLIELGHRRIGFIAGTAELSSARERLAAYQAALADQHIPYDPLLVQPGDFRQSRAYTATHVLLDLPQPPTAIFAANDWSALGVYDAVRDRGLRIPQAISVIGFDDVPQAAHLRPALTTVRQPLAEMGRVAARLLFQYIEDPDQPIQQVVLDTQLIIRESCQPPASAGHDRSPVSAERRRKQQED
jgi:LacI family transcriptional regulator